MPYQIRTYYRMMGKRGRTCLPFFFLSLLITAGILLLLLVVFSRYTEEKQLLPKIRVGVVSGEQDTRTRQLLGLVEQLDAVTELSSFTYLPEAEAEEAFANKELQAVIYLPDDLYNDIDLGRNTPIRIRMDEGAGLTAELFRQLAESGISLIRTAEAEVYMIEALAEQVPMTADAAGLQNELAQRHLELFLRRGSVWDTTTLSAYGGIGRAQFFTLTGLLLLALLSGLSFSGLYRKEDRVLTQCLRRSGIGCGHQGLARTAVMSLLIWLPLLAAAAALSLWQSGTTFRAAAIPLLLLAAFSLAAYIHFLYSVFSEEAGPFGYLLVTVLLVLLGGGLLPAAWLPGPLRALAGVLPVRAWQSCLAGALWTGARASFMIPAAVWGAVFLLAATGIGLAREKGTALFDRPAAEPAVPAGRNVRRRTRFGLFVKRQFLRPELYSMAVISLVFLAVLSRVLLPAADVRVIGIVNEGGSEADALTQELQQSGTPYVFREYPDRDALRREVESGRADCGFCFGPELTRSLENRTLDHAAEYYESTSTTKGGAVRETVFACLQRMLSEKWMEDLLYDPAVFPEQGAVWKDTVRDMYLRQQRSSGLLQVVFEGTEGPSGTIGEASAEEMTGRKEREGYIWRIGGLLLFAAALAFARERFSRAWQGLLPAVRLTQRAGWRLSACFAPMLPFTGWMYLALMLTQRAVRPEGAPGAASAVLPVIAVAVCGAAAALWAMVFSSCFRSLRSYLCGMTCVLILAVLSGGFFSAAGFAPVLRVLGHAFPTWPYGQILGL